MMHELKILKCYADAKVSGDKTFEIRNDIDRGFQKGDKVKYKAVDSLGLSISHPIDKKIYEITYVTAYKQQEGYVVFADREVKQ